ncbi:hypothetical protein M3E13_19515 [Oceanobacillus kimchii]|uniref:hypothetical protein n=1 Tax=Oceanobacillus kimchii TaxID=746691 RepID=UPI0021A2BCF0|nr:hypothetical protein [Oceanobacillus kimchii]MCT1575706.1 hypothetical protein [Oceanobacillus kimchii]MCT2138089.1 hypothetical protein [Oceanobacillus kimchii]
MEITVQDIFNLSQGIEDLANKELPTGVAFNIARIGRIVGEEYKTAQQTRSQIVEKYKEKDLENGRIQLKRDKLDDFQKEVNELMEQKVKVDIQQVKLSDLESISVTPKTLGLIHKIIKEDE